MDSVQCKNCGGNQFYSQDGIQCCEECGLQIYGIEKEIDTFVPITTKPHQRASKKKEENLKGKSFCYSLYFIIHYLVSYFSPPDDKL